MCSKSHNLSLLSEKSVDFLGEGTLVMFFEEMEDCSGVEKCDFTFEIVDTVVFGVEKIGDAEFDSGGGAFVELLAEVDEVLFEVDGDEFV